MTYKAQMKNPDIQVGGSHYTQYAIQPYEFFIKNQIPHHKSAIIRRILRYDHPSGKGIIDLEKINHEIELILELDDCFVDGYFNRWINFKISVSDFIEAIKPNTSSDKLQVIQLIMRYDESIMGQGKIDLNEIKCIVDKLIKIIS